MLRGMLLPVVAVLATPEPLPSSDVISGEARPDDDIYFGGIGNDTIGPVHEGEWDYVMFDAGAPEAPGPDREVRPVSGEAGAPSLPPKPTPL